MYSLLLKKAIPFALTFVLGSFVGGLFKSFVSGGRSYGHARAYHYDYGEGHSCGMRARQRYLVAESKPLAILFKPDAGYPGVSEGHRNSVLVNVTFGADGKVQNVEHLQPLLPDSMLKSVERAAWEIQFEPEMVNGLPVSVTKEVEIHFMGD